MRVLITGGQKGFISGHLWNHFLTRQKEVGWQTLSITSRHHCVHGDGFISRMQCELSNPKEVEQLLATVNPTHIVHLAGPSHHAYPPGELVEGMVNPLVNLLDAAPAGCRFVYASSSSVYPFKEYLCVNHEYDSFQPDNVYGATKLYCENLINLSSMKGVSLRFPAVVGKGSTHGLLHTVMEAALRKESIDLWHDKNSPTHYFTTWGIQPYLSVQDAVAAIEHFLGNDFTGPYNISPEDEISKVDLIDVVREKTEQKIHINFVEDERARNGGYALNCNKARLAGWSAQKSSIEAVCETVRDYLCETRKE